MIDRILRPAPIRWIYLLAGVAYLVWRVGWTLSGAWLPLAIPLLAAECFFFARTATHVFVAGEAIRSGHGHRPATGDLFVVIHDEPLIHLRIAIRAALEVAGRQTLVVVDACRRADVAALCARLGVRHVEPAPDGSVAAAVDPIAAVRPGEFVVVVPASSWPNPDLLFVVADALRDPAVGAAACGVTVLGDVGLVGGDGYRPAVDSEARLAAGLAAHGSVAAMDGPVAFRRRALAAIGGFGHDGVARFDEVALMALRTAGWKTGFVEGPVAVQPAPCDEDDALAHRYRLARGRRELTRLERIGWSARTQTSRWGRLPHLLGVLEIVAVLPRLVLLLLPAGVALTGRVPLTAGPVALLVGVGGFLALTGLARRAVRPAEPLGAEFRRGVRTLATDLRVLGVRRGLAGGARPAVGQGRVLMALLTTTAVATFTQVMGMGRLALPYLAHLLVMTVGLGLFWVIRDAVWSDRQHRTLPRAPHPVPREIGEVAEVSPRGVDAVGGLPVGADVAVVARLPLPRGREWRRLLIGRVERHHTVGGQARSYVRLDVDAEAFDELAYYCGVTAPNLARLGIERRAFGRVTPWDRPRPDGWPPPGNAPVGAARSPERPPVSTPA